MIRSIRMLNYKKLGTGSYIVNEPNSRVNTLNSILLEEKGGKNAVLIDANYPNRYIDELYERIESPASALIFSHCHLDHTAHAYYHEKKFNTPLICPIQEKNHLLSLEALMEDAGFKALGLDDKYKMMVKYYMKFKECKEVNAYKPGDVLSYGRFTIETIHIPGHSPGHTAFRVDSNLNDEKKHILYVSDIGSHPYYGDKSSNLKQYRESIDKLEKIYLTGSYILIPAHGTIYEERNELFFEKIRRKINRNGENVLLHLSKKLPKTIEQLVYEGTITPKNKQDIRVKDLYLVWDGGMIFRHLKEYIAQDLVQNLDNKDFLTDRYILN